MLEQTAGPADRVLGVCAPSFFLLDSDSRSTEQPALRETVACSKPRVASRTGGLPAVTGAVLRRRARRGTARRRRTRTRRRPQPTPGSSRPTLAHTLALTRGITPRRAATRGRASRRRAATQGRGSRRPARSQLGRTAARRRPTTQAPTPARTPGTTHRRARRRPPTRRSRPTRRPGHTRATTRPRGRPTPGSRRRRRRAQPQRPRPRRRRRWGRQARRCTLGRALREARRCTPGRDLWWPPGRRARLRRGRPCSPRRSWTRRRARRAAARSSAASASASSRRSRGRCSRARNSHILEQSMARRACQPGLSLTSPVGGAAPTGNARAQTRAPRDARSAARPAAARPTSGCLPAA